MKASVLILAALFCFGRSVAQGGTPPASPITLTPSSVQNLTVPGFGSMGMTQCDKAGNLYFHAVKQPNDSLIEARGAPFAQTEDAVYLLTGDEIVVLSPAGSTVRKIPVKMTDGGYTPLDVYADGRTVAVTYFKPAKQGPPGAELQPPSARFALFDGFTGERLRVYDPAAELGNNMVCYGDGGFEFLRVKEGLVQIITAHP